MIKKIGCVLAVRRRNHNNYGTSLQAYATIKVLQENGFNVRIIRYNKQRGLFGTLKALPQYLRSGGGDELIIRINKKIQSVFHPRFKFENSLRNHAVEEGFKENIFEPLCDYYNNYEEMSKASSTYDVCLVGSDQLWHPMGLASGFYNLMFVNDSVPKIAYAASFGVSSIPKFQHEGTKKYLERMDWISVREQKGKEIVETLSNAKADFVCDPTMLLTKQEWENFSAPSKKNINEPYIFVYFLGERPEIREKAKELAQKTGCKLVVMRHVDKFIKMDDYFGDFAPYDIDPRDFVNLLRNANYVVTDSFHGTIFSIMMEKKFITFYRVNTLKSGSTHSRIDSLLDKFGLTSRLFKDDIYSQAVADIDYSKVSLKAEEFRQHSKALLLKHLS